jgi:hypothetical protein
MVKVILGSALGGLAAGAIALFAAGQARPAAAPLVPAAYPTTMPAMTQPAGPTVTCGPNQEPAMARVMVNGAEAATLTCVDRAPQGYVMYPQPGMVPQAQLVSLAGAPVPVAAPVQTVPVVRSTPRSTAPVRRVSYQDRGGDIVQYEPDRRQGRSIAKTAMIIGGSAGTGAGVGAIMGGKKGALIGAAIGGGAASIYEATKR